MKVMTECDDPVDSRPFRLLISLSMFIAAHLDCVTDLSQYKYPMRTIATRSLGQADSSHDDL